MTKKLKRIYPLYWLSLPISLLGYVLASLAMNDSSPDLVPNSFMLDLLGSLTGFYSWIGLWGGPYNPPSWFIGLIISLYAVGPLILKGFNKRPYLTLLILLVISVASRMYVGQEGIPFVPTNTYDEVKGWAYRQFGFMPGRPTDWFPLCRIFEFGLGVYIGMRLPKHIWFALQLPFHKVTAYLSNLAFPLFLLHYPWMFLVAVFIDHGMPIIFSIGLYMFSLIMLSYDVSKLESKVLSSLKK